MTNANAPQTILPFHWIENREMLLRSIYEARITACQKQKRFW